MKTHSAAVYAVGSRCRLGRLLRLPPAREACQAQRQSSSHSEPLARNTARLLLKLKVHPHLPAARASHLARSSGQAPLLRVLRQQSPPRPCLQRCGDWKAELSVAAFDVTGSCLYTLIPWPVMSPKHLDSSVFKPGYLSNRQALEPLNSLPQLSVQRLCHASLRIKLPSIYGG